MTKRHFTDCGRTYEHTPHIYVTERGKYKACDGVFREKKTK